MKFISVKYEVDIIKFNIVTYLVRNFGEKIEFPLIKETNSVYLPEFVMPRLKEQVKP